MSFFKTPNPWLLAAGAAHDVGRTYGSTMVDIARIRAMQDAQAREDAWRREQAATQDTRWNLARQDQRQAQEQALDMQRQQLAAQLQMNAIPVNRQIQGDDAANEFVRNIKLIRQPMEAPPMIARPAEQLPSFMEAVPAAYANTPNAGLIDPRVLNSVIAMTKETTPGARSAGYPVLNRIPGTPFAYATHGNSVVGNSLMQLDEQGNPKLASQMVDPAQLATMIATISNQINPNTASDEELALLANLRNMQMNTLGQAAPWTTNMMPQATTQTNKIRRYVPGKGLQ